MVDKIGDWLALFMGFLVVAILLAINMGLLVGIAVVIHWMLLAW